MQDEGEAVVDLSYFQVIRSQVPIDYKFDIGPGSFDWIGPPVDYYLFISPAIQVPTLLCRRYFARRFRKSDFDCGMIRLQDNETGELSWHDTAWYQNIFANIVTWICADR